MLRSAHLFLLFITLTTYSQNARDTIHSVIRNEKSSKHINIPGTRLYMIPPSNFKIANTFIGLERDIYTALNIYDLVGGNFYTNAATFSKEAFEKKGIKVFDYKEIVVNGYPAKYIFLQGDPGTKGFSLVFGDTTFSIMIMAMFLAADRDVDKELIRSFNSIYYDKNRKIDPFETANFFINDKASKFKFWQYNANMYMYSIDGKEIKENKSAPMVLVTQLPTDKETMSVKDIANMMLGKAQEYGLTDPKVEKQSTRKSGDYDIFEGEVYGEWQGSSGLIYCFVIAKANQAIVLQGIARKDIETNLAEFKKLANTIKIK